MEKKVLNQRLDQMKAEGVEFVTGAHVGVNLDANDMKFSTTPGWMSGDDFFTYLKAAFDQLRREGETAPKMMSVGLHCRMVGRPARAAALARFLDYVKGFDDVWIAKRVDIARHWMKVHPYQG